jgi:hypothetical protein
MFYFFERISTRSVPRSITTYYHLESCLTIKLDQQALHQSRISCETFITVSSVNMDLSPAESAYLEGENLFFFHESTACRILKFIFIYLPKFQLVLQPEKAFHILISLLNASTNCFLKFAPESEIHFVLF